MQDDEQTIRDLIATWQRATAAGNLSQLLSLMAEDVVFLVPGQPPMRGRDAFAAGFKMALQHYRIDSSCEVKEIQIAADWAYCWSHLSVTMTPIEGGSPKRRRATPLRSCARSPTVLGLSPATPIC